MRYDLTNWRITMGACGWVVARQCYSSSTQTHVIWEPVSKSLHPLLRTMLANDEQVHLETCRKCTLASGGRSVEEAGGIDQ